jgi:hypothetical protein
MVEHIRASERGGQPHHLIACDALGLDRAWYAVLSHQDNRPTVCPSVASRNLLLYQSLPSSIPYRYAILWRRKDDPSVGTTASGTVA